MRPKQTCTCLIRSVYERCLRICENEATIDFYHGSAICIKLRNRATCRRSLTQWLVSWSSPVVSKVWIKTQGKVKGQKIGRAAVIQTGVTNFQLYHCLSVSVCSRSTWEKSRFPTLKANLATCCKNHPHFQYFFHTLFEAWVARCSPNSDLGRAQKCLVSKRLKSLSMSVLITKSNRLGKIQFSYILVTCALSRKQIASYLLVNGCVNGLNTYKIKVSFYFR